MRRIDGRRIGMGETRNCGVRLEKGIVKNGDIYGQRPERCTELSVDVFVRGR